MYYPFSWKHETDRQYHQCSWKVEFAEYPQMEGLKGKGEGAVYYEISILKLSKLHTARFKVLFIIYYNLQCIMFKWQAF